MRWIAALLGIWGVSALAAYLLPVEKECLLCEPGTREAWLGTDPLGRDVGVRLLRGWSFTVALATGATAFALTWGTAWGLIAGTRPGYIDTAMMTFLQAIWVVPAVLWAAVWSFVIGKGVIPLMLAIGLSTWTETARLVRTEVRRLWGEPFSEAAHALGLPFPRILLTHLLPNLRDVLRVQGLQTFATAVLIEAGLGFVGLGIAPPHVSLGALLFEALSWLTLPQGQLQGVLAGLLLTGTVFAVYSLTGYGRDPL